MKRTIILSAIIFLAGKFSSGQSTFSKCHDTLMSQLKRDMAFNLERYIDWANCVKGTTMPDLSFETISGEKIETKNFKGKVLMINLWFTACHPCIAELPALNRLVKEYDEKDVVFLGLSTDTKERLGEDFFPKYKFDFKIVADAADIIDGIGQTGFPTTYIIDKKGNVKEAWCGGITDATGESEAYKKAKPIIDELLKE